MMGPKNLERGLKRINREEKNSERENWIPLSGDRIKYMEKEDVEVDPTKFSRI